MSTNTETDSLGDIKQTWVQILTLVIHSHKFCAFIAVSSISATSKLESLALFLRLKFHMSQCILAHLPSPSHNPPHQPWLSPGKLRVYKPGGNNLVALPQFSKHFCSEALYYSFSSISICSLKPLWHLSWALLLPGLFTSNSNFLMNFPYPYTPEAPRWGEATLLWH